MKIYHTSSVVIEKPDVLWKVNSYDGRKPNGDAWHQMRQHYNEYVRTF